MKRSKENFRVRLSPKAKKFLNKLPKNDRERILSVLGALRENPFSLNIRKLEGTEFHRVRAGRIYRIIIHIDWENRIVVVFKIDKREKVYDRL
ncbi:type II toxin-antitoxin system RelE family toxin [Geoglobus acetivorans]|uniref:RelE/StbE replicon stabilization toxin n=1 Tax=Geoglobus acetivorans TaxID=565033 RepID=A0A0A7GDN8_GEOAI|nr:RelE/StbE replicon stabilization toxin [Geoglobus acetivorans]